MVRTIKDATVKSFHYASIVELRRHVRDWLMAYNFAKQLKALRFKTPYEAIEELWKSKEDVFIVKSNHHILVVWLRHIIGIIQDVVDFGHKVVWRRGLVKRIG